MANTTFKGPVTSLNGFIGGPNKNAGDTQQGGKNTYSFASTSTVTDGTNTLDATTNEGVLITSIMELLVTLSMLFQMEQTGKE